MCLVAYEINVSAPVKLVSGLFDLSMMPAMKFCDVIGKAF